MNHRNSELHQGTYYDSVSRKGNGPAFANSHVVFNIDY